jgi:MiaB-like tRNA modifying enzyme
MMALLKDAGYTVVKTEEEADAIIINTCTVKDKTIKNFRKRLRNLKKKPTIIAGCIPEAEPERKDIQEYTLVGTEHIRDIVPALQDALVGKRNIHLGTSDENRIAIEQFRTESAIAIIPISKGCLSECSYCLTKKARGDLASFPIDEITERVRQSVADGANQIWLTSQDCGVYGFDIKPRKNIADLLRRVIALPGDFIVRLGMANPIFLHLFLDDLIDVLNSSKIYTFLHIPLQAGSNNVLSIMKRGYTVERFIKVVRHIRDTIPNISIATDIIAGHPGETEADFKETLRVLADIRPEIANYSKFSPRPGTAAETMRQLPKEAIQDRMDRLRKTLEMIFKKNNKTLIGWQGEVIVESKKRAGSVACRTPSYRSVVVPGDFSIGQKLHIEVTGYTTHHLKGTVIRWGGKTHGRDIQGI